ncbi:MAG: peptidoglycan-binding protein [Oscillospiraceae bacterium]|nr:peptidoglycan-binding protein [Oscillospiraceae bacterium]
MRILRMGSRGPAVELLQLALNRAGYGELAVDGLFGPLTEGALRRFQNTEGLAADGVAGRETHRALLPWYTGFRIHRIVRGDTFWALAQRYGSTVEAIRLANPDAQERNLRIGDSLVIPLGFQVVPAGVQWSAALTGYCVRGLQARYPFLTAGEIGRSVLGRPLWRLRLGEGDRRVLYNASHHANEWICTPLLLKFCEELAAAFAAGESIAGVSAAELLSRASVHLIPAVNPDGIDLVTGELEGGESFRQAQRIAADYPQFPFPAGWKANIRGTDLNLQYPAGWEHAKAIKYAQGVVSPAPADFVGRAPLSAPESRALYDYTLALSPRLTMSWHTQGEVIYWRYGAMEPPRAREIGEALAELSGYALADAPYISGFAGYKDWFIACFDCPGYTIEAGRGVNPLPLSEFDAIYRASLPMLARAPLL